MPAVNLNIASYEDLTTLDGIGQHRATGILKLREEKSFLKEENIKQFLQGTYGTIKTLMNEEKVSMDTQPHLLQTMRRNGTTDLKKCQMILKNK